MVWSFSEGNDPNNKGRMTARLGLNVPETDNAQVSGVCEARSGSGVNAASLTLGADVGKLPENSSINLRFTGGGFNHFVSGTVQGTQVEESITGVNLAVKTDDPLWKALTEQETLDYLVPGYRATSLELKAGHEQIRKFIDACRSYAAALKPKKTAQAASGSGGGVSEKEAFEAAKELGTIEAWEAFLTNFAKGFRADLARAYVKRLGSAAPQPPTAVQKTQTPPPPPVVTQAPTPPAPPSPADLSLTVTANQNSCAGGAPCSYTVVATNAGGQPFNGRLVIANSLAPRGARLTASGPTPWACQGMGGGAVCTNGAANIAPGQSSTISLTFTLPRNAGGAVNSCASVSWDGAPTGSSVRDVQQKLNTLGFNVGRPDGKAGRKTVTAIRRFQQQAGLQATGEIDLPLLIAMFTQGGPGDANPANDQACAGSAVISASAPGRAVAPRPSAQYCADGRLRKGGRCVCPPGVPVWTGKTCVPRLTRNCTGGRYYSKKRKLCLCPSSRPHWYNNRCHAGVDDCPGDSVRVGNNCIKENDPAFETTRGGAGIVCPAGTFRVGTNCVQTNQAPVFGNRGNISKPKGGGGRPNTQGGGGQPLFQTQTVACLPGQIRSGNTCKCPTSHPKLNNGRCYKVEGGRWTIHPAQERVQKQQIKSAQDNCQKGEIKNSSGKCICSYALERDKKTGKCRAPCFGGSVPVYGDPNRSCICPKGTVDGPNGVGCVKPNDPTKAQIAPRKSNKCPDPRMILTTSGRCHCGDLPKVGKKCVAFSEMKNYRCVDLGFPDSQASNPNVACKPSGRSLSNNTAKKVCGGGQVLDNAGRCTCPNNLVWRKGKCKKPKGSDILKQFGNPQNQQQQFQQQVNCTGGRVPNKNGQCECPSNKPRWSEGKCKKAKAANQILQQFQQPQQQPAQQPQRQAPPPQTRQQQQQQQIQDGVNNLLKQFSDARLKRDIAHVTTLENGIRLYSFRYLWEDTLRVGVMAQDLLADQAARDAVSVHSSGYYMVDYGRLGLTPDMLARWQARGLASIQPSR